jgi:hypothetical protein
MKISKSKFVAGVQCLKRLYFLVHEPELAAEPDAAAEAIIQQGRESWTARPPFPAGLKFLATVVSIKRSARPES